MKKLITMVLVLSMLISCFAALPAQARVGDVVGTAWHTDIVTYINHYAVPTYVVNDRVVVIAEDLRNFGFSVIWDGTQRTLTIYRDTYINVVKMMNVTKAGQPSTKYRDVLETDIRVYAGGRQITSYNINGMTMIPLEELTMFGSFVWLDEQRVLKMWVEDGLSMNSTMQYVAPYGQAPAPTPTPTPSYPSYNSYSSSFNNLKNTIRTKGRYVTEGAYALSRSYSNGSEISLMYLPSSGTAGNFITLSFYPYKGDRDSRVTFFIEEDKTILLPWVLIKIDDVTAFQAEFNNGIMEVEKGQYTSSTSGLLKSCISLFEEELSDWGCNIKLSDFGITY